MSLEALRRPFQEGGVPAETRMRHLHSTN